MKRQTNYKKVIIKIGSSSLVNDDLSINQPVLILIMQAFKKLSDEGIQPCLVTSGAIAVGMHDLQISEKPKNMGLKQACAAVGQAKLMEYYNKCASIYGLTLGQILVNHDDFQIRKRMTHLSDTLDNMFKKGIIPVINENDALSVDEIKVGDNDTLAGLIAPMIGADLLILFSDIDGLYDADPKKNPDAKLIEEVDRIDQNILKFVGDTSSGVGTGGMKTKIDAAVICTTAGSDMMICNSAEIGNLAEIVAGERKGTLFKRSKGINSREHWIIFKTNSSGEITVDDGLKTALLSKKVSILPSGIKKVEGTFGKGSVVEVKDGEGKTIGKGISAYSDFEIDKIMGKKSDEISSILGYEGKSEVIHANDLVIFKEEFYGRFVK
ncbi:MAG: glutamate 5-kinase [Clostridia bacterium]|nr:glutamate 5-kinase [Clostridia bacterium]